MLQKKFYIPIGIFILVICAVGFLSLRSDTHKVTHPTDISETSSTPETATRDTAEGGDSHAESTPHREETAQEERARLMQRLVKAEATLKAAEAKKKAYRVEIAKAEAAKKAYRVEIAKAEARTAAIQSEFDAMKAKDAERSKHLSRLTGKHEAFAADFQDVLVMTPDKYLALSQTQQEDFLLRCVDYDLFIEDIQGILRSMPQWVIDELNDQRPGEVDEFLNLPSLYDGYYDLGRL